MSRYQQPTHAPQVQVQRRTVPGFGEDIDEAGGIGDEMDSISLRDVASVRYVRHHEWMELVLGSAVNTNKIIPTKVIPDSAAKEKNLWHFDDLESLKKRVEELEQENAKLESSNQQAVPKNEREEYYKASILKLREEFGKTPTGNEQDYAKVLEEKFPGYSVIDKERVRRVVGDLKLPEPQKKDPNFIDLRPSSEPVDDHVDVSMQDAESAKDEAHEADTALEAVPDVDSAMDDLSDVLNM